MLLTGDEKNAKQLDKIQPKKEKSRTNDDYLSQSNHPDYQHGALTIEPSEMELEMLALEKSKKEEAEERARLQNACKESDSKNPEKKSTWYEKTSSDGS